jgi:hypothetical protein
LNNTTAIGYYARATSSNSVKVGNTSVTKIGGIVTWSTYSDERFQKDIKEDVPGLAFIRLLRPVTFRWDIRKLNRFLKTEETDEIMLQAIKRQEKIIYSGFLAQEVEKAAKSIGYSFSGVVHANDESPYSLRYAEFVVPLVKAVQELDQSTREIEKRNKELEERIGRLEELLKK